MSLQQRLQADTALLKGNATEAKGIQDSNIMGARILVEISESDFDS